MMYEYDIVNQIREESKNKMFSEMGVVGFLLTIVLCVVFVGRITNPFKIVKPNSDVELESAYESGIRYVELENVQLDYTGYYKQNNKDEAVYYCYSTKLNQMTYIVFLSVKVAGLSKDNVTEILSEQKIQAKLIQDDELFSLIAEDYNLSKENFKGEYAVSPIILDAAKNDRTEMLTIWILILLLFTICIIYILISYSNMRVMNKNPEVAALSIYGPIDQMIQEINEEVNRNKRFDSYRIKVTSNWLLAFYGGNILIRHRDQIEKAAVTSSIKRVYGFVKVGYTSCVQIFFEDGDSYKIPVDSIAEANELEEILNSSAL